MYANIPPHIGERMTTNPRDRALEWLGPVAGVAALVSELAVALCDVQSDWGFELHPGQDLPALVASDSLRTRLAATLTGTLGSPGCSRGAVDAAVRAEVRTWAHELMANQAHRHRRAQLLGCAPRATLAPLPLADGDRERGLDAARSPQVDEHSRCLRQWYLKEVFDDL